MPPRFKGVLDESRIRQLYETRGMTIMEVCRELDVSQRVLERFMRQYGIQARPKGTRKEDLVAAAERAVEMRRMRAAGRSLSEIGAEFGLSRQRVHQVLAGEG
jgi:transposase-like protein